MALFLVFEGIDGSGKTTQIELLRRKLVDNGHDPLVTSEPDGTPLGKAARRWLRSYPDISPIAELLLFEAARAQHVQKVIRPALDHGRIILCDRFAASTLAYQSWGRGLDANMVQELNRLATDDLRPSLTIFLDLPIETAQSRKDAGYLDNFESLGLEFHQRVRQGYQEIAARNAETWVTVDGTLSKETVAEKIWARLRPLLEPTLKPC